MGFILSILAAIAACVRDWQAHAGSGRRDEHRVSPQYYQGRELFLKVWTPNTSRNAGDGLGPLYNESSCAACHNQGGAGGGGSNDHNVDVMAISVVQPGECGVDTIFRGELAELHPGLRNSMSIVLHHNAVSDADQAKLNGIKAYRGIQTRNDLLSIQHSERSTPALFGAGLIDGISDDILIKAEKQTHAEFPEISGRASPLRDGRLGRFGWKGQTARLNEFVAAACANELGLEVPGHHQVSLVPDRDFDPQTIKLDLDPQGCEALTQFVASLPRPELRRPPKARGQSLLGEAVFARIGCGACHTPKLGHVDGLYSDLLLHDMGDRFASSGMGYGGGNGSMQVVDRSKSSSNGEQPTGEATATEWRTTPLWGVADSAPYLHDGRASTLHQAIQLHGGEAEKTVDRYEKLAKDEQQALLAFLHSLRAPKESQR
jgi:CxxC motif-containing protein (DUF1111 family)